MEWFNHFCGRLTINYTIRIMGMVQIWYDSWQRRCWNFFSKLCDRGNGNVQSGTKNTKLIHIRRAHTAVHLNFEILESLLLNKTFVGAQSETSFFELLRWTFCRYSSSMCETGCVINMHALAVPITDTHSGRSIFPTLGIYCTGYVVKRASLHFSMW